MKFSVLLPTRNRIDLLRHAVESVRMQDYADWEIVISDNASEEDVAGFVASCGDDRIRYSRTDSFLPVTENWNRALEQSSGDYLIMLGDDDALMPGCLSTARQLIASWGDPDVIYTQALQFAYPGVIPGSEQGFIQTGFNAFLENVDSPFFLGRDVAKSMVDAAMSFHVLYGFNMQHFILSRRLVGELAGKGSFFQSPYPDYYAANVILLEAKSILAYPLPLVMIGISPKSFGFYYHNKRENEGVEFLQNLASEDMQKRLRSTLVPGTNMNDSWLVAMETIRQNFPSRHLRVNYRRYRLLQYYSMLRAKYRKGILPVLCSMRIWEIVIYVPLVLIYVAASALPEGLERKIKGQLFASLSGFPSFDPRRVTVPHRDIIEAVQAYNT